MMQTKLDYFTSLTSIAISPSITLYSQASLSPDSKSNCFTRNSGTVVRKDAEFVDARVKTVSIPDGLQGY